MGEIYTEVESTMDKLRRGEKVLCDICKQYYYDVSSPSREYSNYFHCENPECRGYIHVQKNIIVE